MGKKIVEKKNGSKTVIDKGKIVTNFGGSGQKPPTAAHTNKTDDNDKEEHSSKNTKVIQDTYETFNMLSTNNDGQKTGGEESDNILENLDTSNIEVLWQVTRNQPAIDRVNVYARATEHLDDETRCELFTQLLGEESHINVTDYNSAIVFNENFLPLYHMDTYNNKLLDVKTLEMFATFDSGRWCLLKEFVLLDKRLSSKVLYTTAMQKELSEQELKSIANNPNSTNETFVYLLNNVKEEYKRSTLIHSLSKREKLVKREGWHELSEEVLISLAQYPNSEKITTMVKEHKNFSSHTVKILANNPEPFVRKIAAESIKASGETLQTLAKDINIGVQSRVAQNPNTLPETLSYLVQPGKRGAFSSSDKIHISNLVRWRVAGNPHTPKKTLIMLSKDSVDKISITAQETLAKI